MDNNRKSKRVCWRKWNNILNLEDVARGLGFVENSKSGNITVRWRTVRDYLKEFKVIAESCDGKGSEKLPEFIPENIFYKLCMKANNQLARDFQDKVADEILPAIRKTKCMQQKNF
ncbi:BRO family protein [Leptotrichia wadei]|uniref:BRO family protein n=1 Tax=Leptotrichia wadei TaxID=157687 RepID=UPI002F96ADF0